MTLRFSKEKYLIMERNSISIFVSIWKLLFPYRYPKHWSSFLVIVKVLVLFFLFYFFSPKWSLTVTWAYGLILNMRILFLCIPYTPLRYHKKYHWELSTAYVLIILFSFPFIPEADFHCKPQKSRLFYAFFPSTHIFISSLSSWIYFAEKKKKNSTFPSAFFPVDCYSLAPITSNCFTAEPKQHSQQNHSHSILEQSERLHGKG